MPSMPSGATEHAVQKRLCATQSLQESTLAPPGARDRSSYGGSRAMCGTTSLSSEMVKHRMPVSAYLKATFFVVAAAAALFAAAGTVAIPGFWAYLAIFAVVMIVSFAALDPGLLRERMRPGDKKPPLALTVFSLVLFMHWIVAGLDRGRFHWSDDVPGWLQRICLFTVAAGYALALWAMRVNRFFSP